MGKHIYRAKNIEVIDVEKIRNQLGDRVVFGCDAAKDIWFGAVMKEDGVVVQTVKWHQSRDHSKLMEFINELQECGATVEIAVEPTGTYSDSVVYQLQQSGIPVYRVSPKHSHDYSEIYDGVPSSHDGKSAAMVADLHRQGKSRLWTPWSEERRALRAQAAQIDWVAQDIQRYTSRLESRLSRHWPELAEIISLESMTMRALIQEFGSPALVVQKEEQARASIRAASRGKLGQEKVDAVIASAKATIGMPMCSAETSLVQNLGTKLCQLYAEQKNAAATFESTVAQIPSTKPLVAHLGKMTSGILVGVLGDFADYGSVRALQRAAGLNLRIRSSGKQKGTLKLAKRGSSVARRWLFFVALRWVRNPTVGAWFKRKAERPGGNKMKALAEIMRKVLAGMYHVARGKELDLTKLFDTRGVVTN